VTQVKADLDDKWHAKLKHYRDETNVDTISDALEACVQQSLTRYEQENGELPDEYDKPDHPTWN